MLFRSDRLSLANLNHGAAIELFDFELQKVLDNIMDPNAKAEAIREITLKVKIKPNKDRSFGPVTIEPSCKLAGPAPVVTQAFFGMEAGKAVAHEYNSKQGDLFEDEGKEGKVISLEKKGGNE